MLINERYAIDMRERQRDLSAQKMLNEMVEEKINTHIARLANRPRWKKKLIAAVERVEAVTDLIFERIYRALY